MEAVLRGDHIAGLAGAQREAGLFEDLRILPVARVAQVSARFSRSGLSGIFLCDGGEVFSLFQERADLFRLVPLLRDDVPATDAVRQAEERLCSSL
jgi:hypothetical protein